MPSFFPVLCLYHFFLFFSLTFSFDFPLLSFLLLSLLIFFCPSFFLSLFHSFFIVFLFSPDWPQTQGSFFSFLAPLNPDCHHQTSSENPSFLLREWYGKGTNFLNTASIRKVHHSHQGLRLVLEDLCQLLINAHEDKVNSSTYLDTV